MKGVFTILVLLVASNISRAQTPAWLWAKSSNGGNYEDGGGLGYGSDGNLYMSGRFGGTVNIGGVTATAPGQTSVYNAKFDKDGNFSWITPVVYNGGNNYCMGFALDKNSNSYNSGSIESPSTMVFTKYSTSGVVKWDKEIANTVFGGPGNPTGLGLAIGDSGNVYITGELNGSINFGTVTLTSSGSSDIFVAKFDSSGNNIWAIRAGDAGFDEANSIKLDKAGNIYICGNYTGTPAFGSFAAPAAVGGSNFFIAKMNCSGAVQWMATATSAGMLDGAWWPCQSMVIDSCNNVYVTGSYENTSQFGNLSVTSQGSDDMFVAKCMNDGQWSWVKSAGGPSSDRGAAITLDKDFDIYIMGDYSGTAQFGSQSITSSGLQDVFVAKYANSTGDLQWVQTAGSGSNDGATGIAVDDQKFTYLTGTFNGTATFGSNSILATAANVFFVAKLDTAPNLQIAVTPDASYCPGSTASLPFTTNGAFNPSQNVFTAQLSDSTGNFITSQNIGTLSGNSGGNISIQIPLNTPSGSNYSIRVVSSTPAYSSYDYCFRIKIGGGFSININPADTSICSGSSVQLNALGGSTYSWSPGVTLNDSTISNPIANPLTSQTYTVTASSGNCGSNSKFISVNVMPSVHVSVSPSDTTVCSGTSVALLANGASTYSWTPGVTLSDSTGSNPVATPDSSITYSITGNGGVCSNTLLVTVNVGNTAIGGFVTAIRDTICQNTPGNLSLSNNSSSLIQWQSSIDNINFTNLTGDTLTKYKTNPLTESTWYRAVVGGGACTAISDTLQLYVPPSLIAYFNAKQTGSNQLSFNSDSSSGKIRSYHWDFGDNSTSNDSNPLHAYAKDTIYYVCLTLYDGSNCSYTFCRYSEVADAIPTISALGDLVIYPDPFDNRLTIKGKQTLDRIENIEMYDVLGRLVINNSYENRDKSQIYNDLQLDVSMLAKGMYFLRIRTVDVDYVLKVIKQ